ncbi:uncharacterized protein [Cardiocondyla obscurior]|uniref:uncharacterized protein n=1 Tax=Cardiocondyla obscurior TaxID=286306 RepID=UPI0039657A7E
MEGGGQIDQISSPTDRRRHTAYYGGNLNVVGSDRGHINSRPLEPLSDDPQDLAAITPGHILIETALTTVPEPPLNYLEISRLSRWQFIQQRVQYFWTHWSSHYLQRQCLITKWHHRNNENNIGALVLITDERLPPCKWPLARIIALHPGHDGLTQVVTLKTATTTLIRPVVKLAILPLPQPHQEESQPED